MREVHYSERFDTQKSIIRPWQAPGGKGFLLRILLWGAALYLFVFFFFGRGVLESYMEMFRGLAALEAAGETDAEAEALAMFSSLGKLYGSLFLVGIGGWFVAVSVETALHKNIFRGEDRGIFPLWFGRDEGRVMLTQFVLFLSCIAIYFAMIIGVFIFGALVSITGSVGAVIFGLLMFAAFIAGIAALIKLTIRLAPAAAYGVKHNRLVIFEMWKKSKGYGWSIFGSYIITFICGYVLTSGLIYVGMFIVFGDLAASDLLIGDVPEDPDALFSQIAETFNKTSVKVSLGVFMIVYMALSLLWYLHMWGVGNYAADYISEREIID